MDERPGTPPSQRYQPDTPRHNSATHPLRHRRTPSGPLLHRNDGVDIFIMEGPLMMTNPPPPYNDGEDLITTDPTTPLLPSNRPRNPSAVGGTFSQRRGAPETPSKEIRQQQLLGRTPCRVPSPSSRVPAPGDNEPNQNPFSPFRGINSEFDDVVRSRFPTPSCTPRREDDSATNNCIPSHVAVVVYEQTGLPTVNSSCITSVESTPRIRTGYAVPTGSRLLRNSHQLPTVGTRLFDEPPPLPLVASSTIRSPVQPRPVIRRTTLHPMETVHRDPTASWSATPRRLPTTTATSTDSHNLSVEDPTSTADHQVHTPPNEALHGGQQRNMIPEPTTRPSEVMMVNVSGDTNSSLLDSSNEPLAPLRQDTSAPQCDDGGAVDDFEEETDPMEILKMKYRQRYQFLHYIPWRGSREYTPLHLDVNGTVWLVTSILDGMPYAVKEVFADCDVETELSVLCLGNDTSTLFGEWASHFFTKYFTSCRDPQTDATLIQTEYCVAGCVHEMWLPPIPRESPAESSSVTTSPSLRPVIPLFTPRRTQKHSEVPPKADVPSEKFIWKMLTHTLQALASLHHFGFVHGNPVPFNIFFSDNTFRLGNFGCCQRLLPLCTSSNTTARNSSVGEVDVVFTHTMYLPPALSAAYDNLESRDLYIFVSSTLHLLCRCVDRYNGNFGSFLASSNKTAKIPASTTDPIQSIQNLMPHYSQTLCSYLEVLLDYTNPPNILRQLQGGAAVLLPFSKLQLNLCRAYDAQKRCLTMELMTLKQQLQTLQRKRKEEESYYSSMTTSTRTLHHHRNPHHHQERGNFSSCASSDNEGRPSPKQTNLIPGHGGSGVVTTDENLSSTLRTSLNLCSTPPFKEARIEIVPKILCLPINNMNNNTASSYTRPLFPTFRVVGCGDRECDGKHPMGHYHQHPSTRSSVGVRDHVEKLVQRAVDCGHTSLFPLREEVLEVLRCRNKTITLMERPRSLSVR